MKSYAKLSRCKNFNMRDLKKDFCNELLKLFFVVAVLASSAPCAGSRFSAKFELRHLKDDARYLKIWRINKKKMCRGEFRYIKKYFIYWVENWNCCVPFEVSFMLIKDLEFFFSLLPVCFSLVSLMVLKCCELLKQHSHYQKTNTIDGLPDRFYSLRNIISLVTSQN